MSIRRQKDVPLASLSTFRMGGKAAEVVFVESEQDLEELFKTIESGQKWFVLGGGSNIVFPDEDCNTLIIKLASGNPHIEEKNGEVFLHAPAGAVWDKVVAFVVVNGLSGIEALSAIPGSVGGTPIQNVGAYGRETSDVLREVKAFDTQTKKFVTFSNKDCKFGYRDSMFKHEGKDGTLSRK